MTSTLRTHHFLLFEFSHGIPLHKPRHALSNHNKLKSYHPPPGETIRGSAGDENGDDRQARLCLFEVRMPDIYRDSKSSQKLTRHIQVPLRAGAGEDELNARLQCALADSYCIYCTVLCDRVHSPSPPVYQTIRRNS